jgi:hypothetical protein
MNLDFKKRSALLGKISALLTKTTGNGCTEAEALAAAELDFKLVAKYGLNETFPSVIKPVPKPKFVTKPMLSKARRAYRRAGNPNSSSADCRQFCQSLIDAGLDPMRYTSYRLSKYIRGEIKDVRNL